MEKRVLYQVCMSTLILLLFTWNSAQGTPETTDDIFRSFNTNLMLAKNGQKFGYLQSSTLYYTFQWVFVFAIDREVGKDIRKSNFKRWIKNITTLPKIPDGDDWMTNYIGHPLSGASAFVFFKNFGFSNKASFFATFLQSTLFEYTVEAWKQPPSAVDLIVTPLVGSLIGSQVGLNTFIFSFSYVITRFIFRAF